MMSEEQRKRRGLVNRHILTSSLTNELYEKLIELANETRIPKTKLLDEAIEDLLSKWETKK